MTICVGVAAPDGIVLAADSRTTFEHEDGSHRIVSDFAYKVFQVGDEYGVATYGRAMIGNKTIAGLMDEFDAYLGDTELDDVHDVAARLGDFFHERLSAYYVATGQEPPEHGWSLGFLVAGYDGEGIGHIREVGVPGPHFTEPSITTANGGASWRGMTDVIRRMIYGFDGDGFAATEHELPDDLIEPMTSIAYQLLFPLTIQDAIDFASFLIRTTIDMQRFSDGTIVRPGAIPGCGGPTRIMLITPYGVDWISDRPPRGPSKAGWAEGAVD
jgi:hypothetical protein